MKRLFHDKGMVTFVANSVFKIRLGVNACRLEDATLTAPFVIEYGPFNPKVPWGEQIDTVQRRKLVSVAFASEVSAAVSAAPAASARLDPAAANHHECFTVLHHVLSGYSGGKRCAAMTQLPCFIAKVSSATQDHDNYTRHVVAAAALAALSLSFAPTGPSAVHPLSAANEIMSSAASRVGMSLACIESPLQASTRRCMHRVIVSSLHYVAASFSLTSCFLYSGLDVAVVEMLPELGRPNEVRTTFHKLARLYAPVVQPTVAMCHVVSAAAATAWCSDCVSVAVGSGC